MHYILIFLLSFQVADYPSVKCGVHCLYASSYALQNDDLSLQALEEKLGPPDVNGYSISQLETVAKSLGFNTQVVKTSVSRLAKRKEVFACIAHVDQSHFVCIAGIEGPQVCIVDPPNSSMVSAKSLNSRWKGVALLISREQLTPEEDLGGKGNFVTIVATVAACMVLSGFFIARRLWQRR